MVWRLAAVYSVRSGVPGGLLSLFCSHVDEPLASYHMGVDRAIDGGCVRLATAAPRMYPQ